MTSACASAATTSRAAASSSCFTNSLYNRDTFNIDQRDSYRVFATLRQRLSNTAFYQLQGEFQDFRYNQQPERRSRRTSTTSSATATCRTRGDGRRNRYYVLRGGQYVPQYTDDGGTRPGRLAGGTFGLPGRLSLTNYQKSHNQQYRFSGSATAQVGVNQIEFGGEFQQETQRFFSLDAAPLAAYVNDGDGAGASPRLPERRHRVQPVRLRDAPQQRRQQLRLRLPRPQRGRRPEHRRLLPRRRRCPDQHEHRAVPPGLLRRLYPGQDRVPGPRRSARPPRRRVRQQHGRPEGHLRDQADPARRRPRRAPRPASATTTPSTTRSGSRRRLPRPRRQLLRRRRARGPRRTSSSATAAASRSRSPTQRRRLTQADLFQPYEAQVTVMPRVGVSFPVTDRALFFASYNVTSQRPTEDAFAPLSAFDQLDGSRRASPTRACARSGRRSTSSASASASASAPRSASPASTGRRRTRSRRATCSAASRPTARTSTPTSRRRRAPRSTSTSAASTTSRSRPTTRSRSRRARARTPSSTGTAAWRGNFFPQFINPSDFDQRHTANVTLDYRLAGGEGPMIGGVRPFENFGVNLIGQFGSGQRYTRLDDQRRASTSRTRSRRTSRARVNGSTLPATTRLDLRVDRSFNLGFSDSRLRAYVQVQNLLDTQNRLAVYRATGQADEDGFAGTSAGAARCSTRRACCSTTRRTRAARVNVGGQPVLGGRVLLQRPAPGPPRLPLRLLNGHVEGRAPRPAPRLLPSPLSEMARMRYSSLPLLAAARARGAPPQTRARRGRPPASCVLGTAQADLDINNALGRVFNTGSPVLRQRLATALLLRPAGGAEVADLRLRPLGRRQGRRPASRCRRHLRCARHGLQLLARPARRGDRPAGQPGLLPGLRPHLLGHARRTSRLRRRRGSSADLAEWPVQLGAPYFVDANNNGVRNPNTEPRISRGVNDPGYGISGTAINLGGGQSRTSSATRASGGS